MLRARLFEEEVGQAVVSGEIHGEMHLGIGHEAVGAALGRHLRPGDAVVSTHRAHLHALAAGVDPVELAAELLERDGLNHGKGGHMHLFDPAARFMCTGIVGAGVPIAAGYALMQSLEAGRALTVAVMGDGTMNQGAVFETMNLAAVRALPMVFLCEDNQYSISVRREESTAGELSERGAPFGIPGFGCDGTDVDSVDEAMRDAFKVTRNESRPTWWLRRCTGSAAITRATSTCTGRRGEGGGGPGPGPGAQAPAAAPGGGNASGAARGGREPGGGRRGAMVRQGPAAPAAAKGNGKGSCLHRHRRLSRPAIREPGHTWLRPCFARRWTVTARSSSLARTSPGWAGYSGRPGAWPAVLATGGCSIPRCRRRRSWGWPSGPLRPGCGPWWKSCSPTSPGCVSTRSSTRWPRTPICPGDGCGCPWCCGPPWAASGRPPSTRRCSPRRLPTSPG